MIREAAPTPTRATSHLRLVPAAAAPVSPSPVLLPPLASVAAPVRPSGRPRSSRPLMERLRPHLPCRSDAAELRATLASLGPSWRMVRGLTDDGVHSLLVGPGGVLALTVQSLAHARIAVAGAIVTVDGRPVPLVPQRRLVADNLWPPPVGRRRNGHPGARAGGSHPRPAEVVVLRQLADGRVTACPAATSPASRPLRLLS